MSAEVVAPPPVTGFRLAPQQRRLWQLAQRGCRAVAGCALELSGPLVPGRLRQAVAALAARHEVLRTTYPRPAGVRTPLQVVHASLAPAWCEADLSGTPDHDAEVERRFRAELERQWDLAGEPPLRACLLRRAADRHVLLLALPSLAADSASLLAMAREAAALYAAGGGAAAEETVQYVQFSEWQHELLEGEDGEAGRRHWESCDAAAVAPLPLWCERQPDGGEAFLPGQLTVALDGALAAALDGAAATCGAAPEALWLAAWTALLARVGGRGEVAVRMLRDGRAHEELRTALGALARWLPLACRPAPAMPFAELVRQAAAQLREAALWQDGYAGAGDSTGEEDHVGCEVEDWSAPIAAGDLRLRPCRRSCGSGAFKLSLAVTRWPGALTASLEYDRRRLPDDAVAALARQLSTMLAEAAAHPERPLAEIDLLGGAERAQLVVEVNRTARAYPRTSCLHELVLAQAARTPTAVAVAHGAVTLTYGELAARATDLAARLRRLGVGPESVVGVCLHRTPDLVVALLGAMVAGGAYLPLDPQAPQERLALLLADAGAAALVTLRELLAALPPGAPQALCMDDGATPEAVAADLPAAGAAPQNLAYVLHTSGSTGRPKGVMVTHRSVVNYLTWAVEAYGLDDGGSVPLHSPLGVDLTVTSLWAPLLAGARVELIAGEHALEGIARRLAQGAGWSLLKLTPAALSVLDELLAAVAPGGRAGTLVLGGEALSTETVAGWRAQAPATRIVNEYGPTETVVGCTWHEVTAADAGAVPIGRPIGNAQVYLLDAALRPLPAGIAGELYVGGDGVARGYLGKPDLTAERFVPDPFGEGGARLYRTGDGARFRTDGELEYLGRLDQQVKIRGFRVEPGEVEAALRRHPRVREAVVVTRETAPRDRQLVAYVVTSDGFAAWGELRSFLLDRLPEFMVPAAFVPIPAVPLTAGGKVDRAALPALDPRRADLRAPYVAPRTSVEEVLAAIWPQVLGLDDIGIDDNFFTLGGDSIRSVRAVALAKERGIDSAVEQLFAHPTIRELGAVVRTAEEASIPMERAVPFGLVGAADCARMPAGVEDAYPLTSLQTGMLYHMHSSPDYPLYHNVNTWHVRAAFDRAAFEAAVREVVARHPVLRTSFDFTSFSQPLQLVHRQADLVVRFGDLRELSPEAQQQALEALWEEERRRLFDLTQAPHVRLHLDRRSDTTFQLTLVESHAILDGWSTTSTLAEIFEAYLVMAAGGRPRPLPPLATSFHDYVLMESRTLGWSECRAFWAAQLAASSPCPLPRWQERREPPPGEAMGKHHVDIGTEALAALRGVARTVAVPFKTVLLAAHLKTLSLLSGQRDVLSGVVTNGRPEQLDGERVRGLFLNSVPLPFTLAGGSWCELIREVYEAERRMLPYRRYPLARLQQDWGRERLFDVAFTYLHFHSVARLLEGTEVEVLSDDERDFSYNSFLLNVTFFQSPVLPRLRLIFEYDAAELCAPQVSAVGGLLERVLLTLAAEPLAPHDGRSLLGPAERQQALRGLEAAAPAPPGDGLLVRFAAHAARAPHQPAAVCGDRRLTYGQLAAAAAALAERLRDAGVGAESIVALLLPREIELPAAVLGVLGAAGAYLPLDPAHPPARLRAMLEQARPAAALTVTALLPLLDGAPGETICIDGPAPAPDEGSAAACAMLAAAGAAADPDQLAYVVFTSGSTGDPKGTLVTHGGLANYLAWAVEVYGLGEGSTALLHSSLAADLSVTALLGPLAGGGAVELLPESGGAEALPRRLREGALPGLLKLTPSHLDVLAGALHAGGRTGLRTLVLGGENLSWAMLDACRALAPGSTVVNEYGPTETVVGCCAWTVPADAVASGGSVPIGHPIAATRLRVLDAAMQPAPPVTPGELYVGGAGVARGYLGRPDLTAERFVPDPLADLPGARLYRTGDRARLLPDGRLEFLGRTDRQVKVRGHRVELGEVEAALRRLPGVREAVVMPRGEAAGGASDALVAYVVGAAGGAPEAGALRDALGRQLPEHMVPALYVSLAALPLKPNGKLDVQALAAPGAVRPALALPYVAPATPLEQELAAMWAELLQIERVGVDDTFFDLGGNSLLIFRLHRMIAARFGAGKLRLLDLLRYPTVAALAARLAADAPAAPDLDSRGEQLRRSSERVDSQRERMRQAPR